MTLQDYLKKNKLTQRELARRVDVHYMTIYLILKNERLPSPDLAARIEKACDGKVSRMDLLYPNS